MGIEPLPQNLGEALTLMQRSELVAETLGERVFDFFLRNKKSEWEEYRLGHRLRAPQEPAGAVGAGQSDIADPRVSGETAARLSPERARPWAVCGPW